MQPDRGALAVEQDEIGECAADVEANPVTLEIWHRAMDRSRGLGYLYTKSARESLHYIERLRHRRAKQPRAASACWHHSGLMLAARITLLQRCVSSMMKVRIAAAKFHTELGELIAQVG